MTSSILFPGEKLFKANDFFESLKKHGIAMFCGVPDSLLKDFCACITENTTPQQHIIAANEGNAAIAAGYHLATGKIAAVYLQNSGLGNVVNPLLSLLDKAIYNIPALLIIGWRGEPNIADEPQHITQGQLTLPLLEAMGIQWAILEDLAQIPTAVAYMQKTLQPFAFVVKKGTFEPYQKTEIPQKYTLNREEALQQIMALLNDDDIVVATTGMISREWYENRTTHEKDFLVVGSMGHASSIALGIALEKPNRRVFVLDGDGAFLMHQGAASVIAACKLPNFKHIVLDNEAHDSVGGQPTVMDVVCIADVAKACGYARVFNVFSLEEIRAVWQEFYTCQATALLNIKVKRGARKNLGRPREKPIENKTAFMQFLK